MGNWERRMKKGRLQYGIVDGSVFGVIMLLVTELFSLFLEEGYAFSWANFALAFCIWIIGGMLIYGTLMWSMHMYYYKKFSKKLARQVQGEH
ncbi:MULTISPECIES: hypothetical protein [unclassified Myroides]|uniref:hypothetical protein n=1 Tax=unclassified Myroides TaxID=2642485 RepID=UPI003D2F5505